MKSRAEIIASHIGINKQYLPLIVFQEAWGEWADATFPNSTRESIASHFREEAREFAGGEIIEAGQVVEMHGPSFDPEEAADCLLLLLHDAHKAGYNLMEVALQKAKVNIERDWDVDDDAGHGHFKHKEKADG